MSAPKDRTGITRGKLTFIRPTGNKNYKGSIMWEVRCDCGTVLELASETVFRKSDMHVASCGCADTVEGRFWYYVDKGGPDECWIWKLAKPGKYGRLRVGKKTILSHRLAYEIGNATSIPEGLLVRHSCDNRPCCNPAHLSIGTHKDNHNDAMSRDRHTRGMRTSWAKLTDDDVIEIRKRHAAGGITYVQLAELYGVSDTTISRIVLCRNWKHLL